MIEIRGTTGISGASTVYPRYWIKAMNARARVCVSTLGQLHGTVTWLFHLILGLRSLSSCLYHI